MNFFCSSTNALMDFGLWKFSLRDHFHYHPIGYLLVENKNLQLFSWHYHPIGYLLVENENLQLFSWHYHPIGYLLVENENYNCFRGIKSKKTISDPLKYLWWGFRQRKQKHIVCTYVHVFNIFCLRVYLILIMSVPIMPHDIIKTTFLKRTRLSNGLLLYRKNVQIKTHSFCADHKWCTNTLEPNVIWKWNFAQVINFLRRFF